MTEVEYFQLVQNNFWGFIFIFVAALTLYYFLLSGKIVSLFDPLLTSFVASAMGLTTVVLLYVTGTIDGRYFLSYLATQTAFIAGFLYASCTSTAARAGVLRFLPLVSASSALFVVLPIYSFTCLVYYAKFGIPLLSDVSRLESYYQSDVVSSILNKVYNPTAIIAATLAVACFQAKPLTVRIASRITLALVIVNVLLSGSKGSLLVIVGIIYYCAVFFERSGRPLANSLTRMIKAHPLLLMFVVFVGFMLVAWIRYDVGPLAILVARVAMSGDIYYLAYPNHVLDNIHTSGILAALFPGWGSLLGVQEKGLPLGVQVFEYVMGYERLEAPNARHNVFGLVHLGYVFSVLYSGFLGYLLGFARFQLLLYSKRRIAGLVMFVGVTFALSGIEADAGLSISNVIGTVICATVYLFAAALLERAVQHDMKLHEG